MGRSIFPPQYKVERLRGDGHYEDVQELKRALQKYANQLRVNIEFWAPHGNESEIEEKPEVLQIKFWSTPVKSPKTKIYSAYGIRLDGGQPDAFYSSKTLFTVYDNFGTPVAEFSPETIYVLFDLPHGDSASRLVQYIMDDYLLYIKAVKTKTIPDFLKIMEERRERSSLDNLNQICAISSGINIERAKERLSEIEENIREIRQELIAHERKKTDYLRVINPTKKKNPEPQAEELENLFKRLKALSPTGELLISQNEIRVSVGQIDIPYEDEIYDIGEFDVIIYGDGEDGGVKCINTTRNVGYYHPHVDEDGESCLGNISDAVAMLIGQMKYDIVIQIMIDFLRSVNNDGWMESVTQWPKKGESEKDYRERIGEE